MSYSYACSDYPGMAPCPGCFEAKTEGELWQHIELHSSVAHDEDPAAWTSEETAQVRALIKTES